MSLFAAIKAFFTKLFSHDPADARKKAELKRLYSKLSGIHPAYYRPKTNQVMPAFAQALYSYCITLRPLIEVARATIANSDSHTSLRYFDYLIESRLPKETRDLLASFSYDAMNARFMNSFNSNEEIEKLNQEFQSCLREIDALGADEINLDLNQIDQFIEICRFDYERPLGLFDPSVNLALSSYKPDFSPAQGELLNPELVDLYYLFDGFTFDASLKRNIMRLLERRSLAPVDAARAKKINAIFDRLDKLSADLLNPNIIIDLVRATKGDPDIQLKAERENRDFVEAYKRRLRQLFERNRERIQRERHESAIAADVKALFGDSQIAQLEGYNEEEDAKIRREWPNGFLWIKPLRLLKTFVIMVFAPSIDETLKRFLVEGYFDNKAFQNNLANVLYQCERTLSHIEAFEEQLSGNSRLSIMTVERYAEEAKVGNDISTYLDRLLDNINARAKKLIDEESSLYIMLGDAVSDLVADSRKQSPELVTNIHSIGGGRHREILAQMQGDRDKILGFIKIMRNFTVIASPAPGALSNGTVEAAAGQPEIRSNIQPDQNPQSISMRDLEDASTPSSAVQAEENAAEAAPAASKDQPGSPQKPGAKDGTPQ